MLRSLLPFVVWIVVGLPSGLCAADPATPGQIHQTVERGIKYQQAESSKWLSTRKCAACHHAPLVLWSLNEAARYGYTVDQKFLTDTGESTFGSPDKLIAAKIFNDPADPPDTRPLGKGVKIASAFLAVAGQSYPTLTPGQKQSLKFIADHIVEKQRPDGGWDFFLSRPPINETELSDAVWLIMALESPDATDSHRAAHAKALAWLATTKFPNLQDKVFKLLLAVRQHKPRAELQPLIDELFKLQRPEGGWAQKPDMPTDAYATGQTLYALSLAGEKPDRPEIQRAVNFLVSTQKRDGSWTMTSRSTPDGSPGSSKLLTPIQCAAASWATLALSHLHPQK